MNITLPQPPLDPGAIAWRETLPPVFARHYAELLGVALDAPPPHRQVADSAAFAQAAEEAARRFGLIAVALRDFRAPLWVRGGTRDAEALAWARGFIDFVVPFAPPAGRVADLAPGGGYRAALLARARADLRIDTPDPEPDIERLFRLNTAPYGQIGRGVAAAPAASEAIIDADLVLVTPESVAALPPEAAQALGAVTAVAVDIDCTELPAALLTRFPPSSHRVSALPGYTIFFQRAPAPPRPRGARPLIDAFGPPLAYQLHGPPRLSPLPVLAGTSSIALDLARDAAAPTEDAARIDIALRLGGERHFTAALHYEAPADAPPARFVFALTFGSEVLVEQALTLTAAATADFAVALPELRGAATLSLAAERDLAATGPARAIWRQPRLG